MWSVAMFSAAASLPACAALHQHASPAVQKGPAVEDVTTRAAGTGVEVMPLHQKLGVRFLPDNGEDLGSVVASLSAMGLQARYSVDEMKENEPTPWKTFWNRELCVQKRETQKMDDYFLACHAYADTIWTPKHKLAYTKTPKAASTAFSDFFMKHFSDAEWISPHELPDDTYVFTFARDPFEHKLAGFAEIDLKTEQGLGTTLDNTTFQNVPRSVDKGQARFAALLNDVWYRRFNKHDARRPGHVKNQVGTALCSHSVDFFGHLEHLTTDWDQIQAEANLPQELRTKALPIVHADTSTTKPIYKYDESILLNDDLKERVCKIYSSEFACLGYDAPTYCQKYGLP